MSVAREFAEFLAGIEPEDLSPPAVEHAAMLIASTLASAAMGSRLESAATIRALACERGGAAEASVWFEAGAKLPVADAARVNAVASDAAASDDSDLRNIVHAGTPSVAAALALGERAGAEGAQILTAIVLGYESAGRLGAAVTPGLRERGFHGSIAAIFAAAVAAGRLMRLDAAQLAQAIALSATSIGGLMAAANTSVAREYHAGLAAFLGVEAARAAQRGYRAEEGIIEAPRGFLETYGGRDAGVTRDLGGSWVIMTDMAIKLMPGGHPYPALAEAAANAARDADIRPEAVESITVSRPGFAALTGPLHPTDLVGMAHSPAYFLAAGAADREFSWRHATPEKIADPVIHRLIDKIRIGPPPTAEDAARYRQGASVTIRATDGRTGTSTVFAPKGAAAGGIGWADIDPKYRALMPQSGLPPVQIEVALNEIHGFRRLRNFAGFMSLLRPPRRS